MGAPNSVPTPPGWADGWKMGLPVVSTIPARWLYTVARVAYTLTLLTRLRQANVLASSA